MAAKKKSASRRPAAKAKAKKAKTKTAKSKKAKPRPKARKAAVRKRPAAKKAAAPMAPRPLAQSSPGLMEIDQRIAIVRNNLRDLMEQASGTSGSASEELLSDRITSQEAELQRLRRERDALAQSETR